MIHLLQLVLNRWPSKKFWRGQTMAEYSLILAAIAVVVFISYTQTGQAIADLVSWGKIRDDLLGL
jgi:Flp pilus assembly pilin Flp